MSAAGGNIFADVARRLAEEEFAALVATGAVRIERIVSTGQASPPDFWHDQDRAEWVIVLRGAAGIRFADEDGVRVLAPGDYVLIPAHARHRVEWTSPDEATVWLAVHFG
jgi:cupin 2 domain-containing protein